MTNDQHLQQQALLQALEEVEGGARRMLEASGWSSQCTPGGVPAWAHEVARSAWAQLVLGVPGDGGMGRAQREQVVGCVVAALQAGRGDAGVARTLQVVVGLGGGSRVVSWACQVYAGAPPSSCTTP